MEIPDKLIPQRQLLLLLLLLLFILARAVREAASAS